METSPAPAAPATDMEPATLFVALELSKAKWLVGLHSPTADKISRHTITGGDAPALLGLIEAARRRAEASLGGEVQIVACYEAGYAAFGCTGSCWRTASPIRSSTRRACWSTAVPAVARPIGSILPVCCARSWHGIAASRRSAA